MVLIKAGDVVLEDEPFVHTLSPCQKSKRCDHCLNLSEKLLKCSACKSMYYCSKGCQRSDWPNGHKFECPLYKCRRPEQFNFEPEFNHTLLIRYAMRLKGDAKKCSQLKWTLYDGRIRTLSSQMNHKDELIKSSPSEVSFVQRLCKELNELGFEFDEDFLLEKYSELFTNSMAMIDERSMSIEPVGTALYIAGSCFDHSCRPTLNRVFYGRKVQMRALKDLDTSLEQPTICYIDAIQPRNSRRAILKKGWCFDCQCSKCSTHADRDFDYERFRELDEQALSGQRPELIRPAIVLSQELFGAHHPRTTAHLNNLFCKVIGDLFDGPDASVDSLTTARSADVKPDQSMATRLENVRATERLLDRAIKVTHGADSDLYRMFEQFRTAAYSQLRSAYGINLP